MPTAPPVPVIVECRWTDQPITIDGRADEPAWAAAQTVDHFRLFWNSGTDRIPHGATSAKFLWDSEYFYFYAEMADHDLEARIVQHNGTIWTDDAFELFFKPTDEKPGYYEFEVNPNNATMEMFLPARGQGFPQAAEQTHIAMLCAILLHGTLNAPDDTDTGWAVEGRIPWHDMGYTGGKPNPGDAWKFAACRVDVTAGSDKPELSSCAPLKIPNFHHYEDYATLKFIGPGAR